VMAPFRASVDRSTTREDHTKLQCQHLLSCHSDIQAPVGLP
jgi:hypothetical protein